MKSSNSRTARKAGFTAGAAYVAKINDLCAQAGKPQRADGFVARRASLDDVRVALGFGTANDRDGWSKAIAALATDAPSGAGPASWDKAIAALGQSRRRR